MGINEKLSVRELMFGFDGRLGRPGFLKYAGILGLILFVTFALSSTLVERLVLVLQPINLSAISVMSAIGAWPATAIICKRLHDMDRSGFHTMWVCPLFLVPLGWVPAHWAMADIAALSIAIGWLAFTPGTIGPNFHGLRGGMRVHRIIDTPPSDTNVIRIEGFQKQATE